MKITIVGLAGSGKTTLARKISEKLRIPHIHLDRFWFEKGGLGINKNSSEEEKKIIRQHIREKTLEAILQDAWVSDGFYSRVQPEIAEKADVVIFLDLPLWTRFFNHAKRIFQSDRHPELSFWNEIAFFPEIFKRQRRHKAKLLKLVDQFENKVVRLTSRKEIDKYFENLAEGRVE